MEQRRTTGGEEENRTHLDKTTHSHTYRYSHSVLTRPAHWVSIPLEFFAVLKTMNQKDALRNV